MGDDRGSKLEFDPPNTSRPPEPERETVRPRMREEAERTRTQGSAGEPRRESAGEAGDRRPASAGSDSNRPMVISILYLTSLVVGLTGLVALILALVWKSEPGEPWEASHYDYHIMTFVLWFAATVLGFVLIFTIIGIFFGIIVLILAYVWVLVRAIMSMVRASNREPMPNPGTWLA